MKLKKTAALALAAVIALNGSAAALGSEIYSSGQPIGEGTRLNEYIYDYTERQNEHYIEYIPNETVQPVVVYGSKLCNYGDFESMAALLEKQGMKVIGGVNGDYYVMSSYQPLGVVICGGELMSSDGGYAGIGFRADGSVVLGNPGISAKVSLSGREYRLYGINKTISSEDFYLYSYKYSYTTKHTVPTVDVLLSAPEDFVLTPNCEAEFTVDSIEMSNSAMEIPEGKYVLSLTQDSTEWRMEGMRALYPGDKVTVSVSSSEAWADVQNAVGSLYTILKDGVVQYDIDDKQSAPRTAVGERADGSVVFYTVDGRQTGYSKGLKISEVAERLKELGCVNANLLDGGGSTNLHAQYIGGDSAGQINKPSGGRQRSVTNYIMLVTKPEYAGNAALISVYPHEPIVLSGSEMKFSINAADAYSVKTSVPSDIAWSVTGGGSVDDGGVYKAGSAGTDIISAQAGNASDSSKIYVITTPDSIKITDEKGNALTSLSAYNGDTVKLLAASEYKKLSVISDNRAYKWSVSDETGAVTEDGEFTAGDYPGKTALTVSAGGASKTIDINVLSKIICTEAFEDYVPPFLGPERLSAESNRELVRFGKGSLRVDYSCETAGELAFEQKLDDSARFVSLHIYGDGSGNKIGLKFKNGDEQWLTALDYTGWQQFIVPASDKTIASLMFEGEGEGTVYIDQIVSSTSKQIDIKAPEIELSEAEGTIKAIIKDDCDASVEKANIALKIDGKDAPFDYTPASGVLKASLEGLAGLHRVSVTAKDNSGNAAVSSLMLRIEPPEPEGEENGETGEEAPAEPEPVEEPETPKTPFADAEDHWAEEYIEYMYALGVVSGMETENGIMFKPDNPVTRAQFAVMICRLFGISSEGEAAAPEFADAASIPDWAAKEINAVCSAGIMAGMNEPSGLYFAPSKAITREQAMTVIGRILECGFAEDDLAAYSDADKVQNWALKYVRSLVGRGVVSGYEDGTLRPAATVTRSQIAKILTEIL